MREFTPLAIGLGIIIGVLFAMANAFIGLKVGIVITASIPAAVISMGILRGILKRGTILENNMVQTVASSGESLAAGMIFTIPALYIFGFDPKFLEMVIWGAIGGLLGVLFMVPLRHALIVREHDRLPYPEGVACAEVLEAGDRGGSGARPVFWGLSVGLLYQLFRGFGFWKESVHLPIPRAGTAFGLNASPALLGVGYILGVRIAGYMLGGAVLGWFVIIPSIAFFGSGGDAPIAPEPEKLITAMSPEDMWNRYLRYIGAGAVVLGGLLSLIKSAPTIASSIWNATIAVFSRGRAVVDRTARDIPFPLLVLLIAGLAYFMVHFEQVRVGVWGAVAVLVFGFFFVTVSSRLAGLVGNSSNPASGMTIATLLGTALLFTYVLGESGDSAKFTVISVGALVCIAVCIAGDCSQDLKTGFLLRATPWKQQIGEIIGVLATTAAIAWVIAAIHGTYGYVATDQTPHPVLAPQANIMKLLVEGIMDGTLPWVLIITGMACAAVIELLGIPALPVAVGLYLPFRLSAAIMAGALIRWAMDRRRVVREGHDPGILGASGLVAGEGLVGVIMVGGAAFVGWFWNDPDFTNPLTGESERVLPHHLMPWLSEKLGFSAQYGLNDLGPWLHERFGWLTSYDYAQRTRLGFDLLPLLPFLFLMLWLARTAYRRPPTPTQFRASPVPLKPEDIDSTDVEPDEILPIREESYDPKEN